MTRSAQYSHTLKKLYCATDLKTESLCTFIMHKNSLSESNELMCYILHCLQLFKLHAP